LLIFSFPHPKKSPALPSEREFFPDSWKKSASKTGVHPVLSKRRASAKLSAMPPLLPATIARNLRDGLLTERQKLGYVVLYLLVQTATRLINSPTQRSPWQYLLYAGISLVGTWFSFHTNARGDNRNFIERWLCLLFSISIWVLYLPALLIDGAYITLFRIYGTSIYALLPVWSSASRILNFVLLGLLYVLLNHFIRIAASGPASQEESIPFAPIAAP